MKLIKDLLMVVLIFSANVALAEDTYKVAADPNAPAATAAPVVQRGKKSASIKLNYDNELVLGTTMKPDVDNINMRKTFNFKKIIRIRENFMNEMEDSVDSFKAN